MAALSLTLLLGAYVFIDSGSAPSASASSEAAALIGDFNGYRAAHNAPALVESSVLDSSALAASQTSCSNGGYILPSAPPGASSFVAWQVYGYGTADQVWTAEQTDPGILAFIANSVYNTAGVGVTS